ncbi:MAG: type I methionyl aminopeptidase [Francisellaceae bacterium]|jgi:methionyl aminopeptidase|nr:type I methionyl aminopeptidase [Francisellaceae bacterium]MBT6206627.1 type I methionyl aminopeptidase [Francisellaceae bacterium]MBT6539523.1 type I methionyl aminopeptidase [Francisellaceae bacterium]
MKNMIKTPEQIEKMRTVGKLAGKTLDMIGPHVQAGITTDELNTICHKYITEDLNSIPAPLNYKGFPKSICTSINHQVCHGIPNERPLKNGDIINIDVTLIKDGYHGDTSKMFVVGNASILANRLITITRECLMLGISQVMPGKRLGDIGAIIQEHAHKARYSVVREYCGHGIGLGFHEEPQIVHYGKPNTGMFLQEGMTFTIEPMINAGKRTNKLLADDWTVVTKDRSLSAQWEHTILVTSNGCEILTLRDEELEMELPSNVTNQ